MAHSRSAPVERVDLSPARHDLRDMEDVVRLRYWQHQINELLKTTPSNIPIHLGFGHEAAAVALDRTVGSADQVCVSHRNSVYNMVRARSFEQVLSHYRLETEATPAALMGSMNLAVKGTGIAYASSILGNNLSVGAGIAMHRHLTARDGVVFVLTGDGAMEEGAFWETIIFARSHHLPLVVVVENNDCSMSSTIAQRRSPIDLALVAEGVGLGYHHAVGADVPSTRAALDAAQEEARRGAPAIVELRLSTLNQHAGPTPGWPGDVLNITLDDGLLIHDDGRDPLFYVKERIGAAAFRDIVNMVIGEMVQ